MARPLTLFTAKERRSILECASWPLYDLKPIPGGALDLALAGLYCLQKRNTGKQRVLDLLTQIFQ
jgi:hypothetical protein